MSTTLTLSRLLLVLAVILWAVIHLTHVRKTKSWNLDTSDVIILMLLAFYAMFGW